MHFSLSVSAHSSLISIFHSLLLMKIVLLLKEIALRYISHSFFTRLLFTFLSFYLFSFHFRADDANICSMLRECSDVMQKVDDFIYFSFLSEFHIFFFNFFPFSQCYCQPLLQYEKIQTLKLLSILI